MSARGVQNIKTKQRRVSLLNNAKRQVVLKNTQLNNVSNILTSPDPKVDRPNYSLGDTSRFQTATAYFNCLDKSILDDYLVKIMQWFGRQYRERPNISEDEFASTFFFSIFNLPLRQRITMESVEDLKEMEKLLSEKMPDDADDDDDEKLTQPIESIDISDDPDEEKAVYLKEILEKKTITCSNESKDEKKKNFILICWSCQFVFV